MTDRAIALVVSAIAGSVAAARSRKSRLDAASHLEDSLSGSHRPIPIVNSIDSTDSQIIKRYVDRRSWALGIHAVVSCILVHLLSTTIMAPWPAHHQTSGNGNGLLYDKIMSKVKIYSSNDYDYMWGLMVSVGQLGILLSLLGHAYVYMKRREETSTTTKTRQGRSVVDTDFVSKSKNSVCNGRWIKDKDASDSMEPICDLMGIYGITRFALRFIVGSDVSFSLCPSKSGEEETMCFGFAAFSVIKWFKIQEKYPVDSTVVSHRRRDLRRGGMKGSMVFGQDTTEVIVRNTFQCDNPRYCGTLEEVFSWPEENTMLVDSVLKTPEGSASFRQVFHREQSS